MRLSPALPSDFGRLRRQQQSDVAPPLRRSAPLLLLRRWVSSLLFRSFSSEPFPTCLGAEISNDPTMPPVLAFLAVGGCFLALAEVRKPRARREPLSRRGSVRERCWEAGGGKSLKPPPGDVSCEAAGDQDRGAVMARGSRATCWSD